MALALSSCYRGSGERPNWCPANTFTGSCHYEKPDSRRERFKDFDSGRNAVNGSIFSALIAGSGRGEDSGKPFPPLKKNGPEIDYVWCGQPLFQHRIDDRDQPALEGALFGVRVNAVAPGPIETEMLSRFAGSDDRKAAFAAGVPLKRLGRPEEIAEAIVFVASDKASFISGASIAVNGGKAAL